MDKKRLLIIPAAGNMNFLGDIAEALKEKFEIYIHNSGIEQNVYFSQYDYVWLEWADGYPLFLATKFTKEQLGAARIIFRIHKYELMIERTLSEIKKINPDMIDKLIFVSDYMKQIGLFQFPWMEMGEVMPNLIDHTKFPYVERKSKGYNLLYLGRIGHIKNLPYLMQLFYELLLCDGRYKLHVVGEMYDKEIYYFKENFIKKIPYLDIGKNIIFHGQIKHSEVPAMMAEMDYIVSTSTFESQGVGAIEGMCTGMKPVIYNYGSADESFQPEHLFMTRADFLNRILYGKCDSIKYHEYAVRNFSIKENLWRYVKIIEGE